MASSTEYSFKLIIAFRGYHVFKEAAWNNSKEGDSVRVDSEVNEIPKNVDPYVCAIHVKNHFF